MAATDTSGRKAIVGALMLSLALVAMDSTIVATAVPSIVRDVGGFAQYPWLFSIYLLTSAVTVPLYGKFADVVGRKRVLFVGIALFLIGSVLCGVAWNMLSLIIARGIQGAGAGAVMPVTMTVIGDLYTPAERGKVQGYVASVWGISAVVGPTLGGFFTDYMSWRWIFFINRPLGVGAVMMLTTYFHENIAHRPHTIDYAGAISLTGGCSLLVLGLLEGGVGWAWTSPIGIGVFAIAALLLIAFVMFERRAVEPVLPLWVFGRRTLIAGNLASLAIGAITIGLSSYVPTYVQGVLGTGAMVAGFTLATMTIGWPIASTVAARLYMRIGYRTTALLGSVFCIGGAVLFSMLHETSSVIHVAACSFVVGVGLGLVSTAVIVAVQSTVGWERRGVVTGSNMFTRSIGSAVGVAVFGAIANSSLRHHLDSAPATIANQLPQSLDVTSLLLGGAHSLGVEAANLVRSGLFDAMHLIFVALVIVAILGAVVQTLLPQRQSALKFDEPPTSSAEAAQAGTELASGALEG